MISKIVTLGDVCNKGSSNIAQKDLVDRDGIYPIYGAAGYIKNVDFAHQDKPYLAVVKDGAGIGRVMKLPANSSIIGTMQYILPKGNIDIDYLYFALQYMNLSKYFSGSTIPHIYFRDYQKEKLPLPELSEQQGKAYVLLRIEQLIEYYHQQLTKLDELVKSQFIEIILPLIKSNCTVALDDLVEDDRPITYGILKPGTGVEGGIPVVKVKDMQNGVIDQTDLLRTSVEIDQQYKRSRLRAGDLLISIRGSVGRLAEEPNSLENANITQDTARLTIKPAYNRIYIRGVLESYPLQMDMEKNIRGVAVKGINIGYLRQLPIPMCPRTQQDYLAGLYQQADKSKLAVKQSLEKLETLKKSLMQQYFG